MVPPDSLPPPIGVGDDGRPSEPDASLPDSVEELRRFEFAWLHALGNTANPRERAKWFQKAGEVADRFSPEESDEGWRFARSWLRALSADVESARIDLADNPELAVQAQKVFRALVARSQPDIAAWHKARDAGGDMIQFLRHAPSSAEAIRDLGRLALALRGSGALSLGDVDSINDVIEFADSIAARSRRTLSVVADWLRITREELLRWADSPSGPQQLPTLVRRLIQETGAGIERLHFPGGGGTALGGWDGMVVAVGSDIHVPEGVSGWELSTKKKSQEKAEKDYANRTSSPDGSPTHEVTYVQVICRPWTKASKFANEKTLESRWREVRAYNVDDLETWLERAPATSVWLAEMLGRPVAGVSTADAWWHEWLRSTTVPLDADIVLAGRDELVSQLRTRVKESGITTVGGEVRLEEIRAFVAAIFHDGANDSTGSRMIFLDDPDRARQLLQQAGDLIALAPSPDYLRGLPTALGHHLLVAVPGSAQADLVLPPVAAEPVAQALEAAGFRSREASDLGALARRSLLALRRHLAVHRELHLPSWSAAGADALQRRTLLLNAWNQTKVGDREAVSRFIGQGYDVIEDSLRSLASAPDDPMVSIVDERWHVVSPMDAWILLGSQITVDDLDGFRETVKEVLLDPDPLLDLPEDERWRASLDGITRRFSSALRQGLARTLALMGALDMVVGAGRTTTSSFAESTVWQLLKAANDDGTPRTWLTIAPLLPLLAEAAPNVFLSTLQEALGSYKSLAQAMFTDQERGMFGSPRSSPHTDFLWALETLAWSPEHFDTAVSLLATLAEIDPGGEWSNRPSASLQSVFIPWHPNTSASAEQRLATLTRLRKRNPDVAWNLMVSMLPSAHGFQVVHQGPAYRDWKASEPVVTRTEYWSMVEAVGEALLEDVGRDSARWVTLIKDFDNLSPTAREEARRQLLILADEALTDDHQFAIWQALRDFVAHHREYSDANWALPAEELDALDVVVRTFAPPSPGRRHAWLFKEDMVTLGDVKRRDDFDAYDAAVQERRVEAVREIVGEHGFDALLKFAAETVAGYVGYSLAEAFGERFEERIFPLLASDQRSEVDFAFSYFGRRFRDEGWPWLDHLLESRTEASPAVVARLLRSTRDPAEAARRVNERGGEIATEFWKNFSYVGLGQDFPHVLEVSSRLVEVGRNAAALDLLALYARRTDLETKYPEAIATAFEGLREHPNDPELHHLSEFEIRTLIQILTHHREHLGVQRVISIEWFFLPMLGFEPDAPNLHRALAESPEFFSQLLSLIFRREGEDKEASALTDEQRRAAENAHRLMSSWTVCPGADESGVVDPTRLRRLVAEARRLLSEAGRSKIGDQQIGQALAAAPGGEDGVWPAETVRDLLEELQNNEIDRGLEIAIYNNRGVTSRALDEGGKQEWKLVEDYRQRAAAQLVRWPRTAAIYRRLG